MDCGVLGSIPGAWSGTSASWKARNGVRLWREGVADTDLTAAFLRLPLGDAFFGLTRSSHARRFRSSNHWDQT